MKRALILAGMALATAVPLAGCVDDYGYGYGYSRPYSYSHYYPGGYGWYDGYYGSVYDGYWGNGGTYYYRMDRDDRWRRDDGRHFRYGRDNPGNGWRRWDRDNRRGRHHDHDNDD